MPNKRWVTALALLAGFLACLFLLPDAAWAAVLLLPLTLGAKEWAQLSGFNTFARGGYALLTAALAAALYIWGDDHHAAVYLLASGFWLAAAPLWLALGWRLAHPLLRSASGWLVLVPLWLAMVELRHFSPVAVLLLMGVVWISDSAAYFSGRRFGKHKLAPAISPGKTWEGVAGAGLAVSLYALLALGVAVALGRIENAADWLLPTVLLVWLLLYLGILGDLFESWIKRLAGTKDSGTILPGHGGVLDRIDALTAALPVAALILLHGHLLERT